MNLEKIKTIYINLYHECLNFIIDPISVWEKVVNEKRSWTDTQTRLLYPLLALICVLGLIRVMIENFYISDYDLLTQTLLAIAWPIILAISLVIAAVVGRLLFNYWIKNSNYFKDITPIDFERIVVFLSYAEIPVFLSCMILAIMPFMFSVLIFLNFYSAYIIMSGYNVYFADIMGEDRKYYFPSTLVTVTIIYALTYIAWNSLAKI